MAKITLRPNSASGDSWSNMNHTYDGDKSTSASVSVSRFNYSSRTLTLNFNTSVIPSGATINSATLTLRSKAGKNTITAYVDINGDSQHRVIEQKQATTITTCTANVASYIFNLQNVVVTAHNSNWSGNTFELYELWIDVDYTEPTTTYTVRFLDWDNSVISAQTVTRGGSATAPPNPTRDGYVFTGWDKSFTNITANTDIHAQYTIKTSTVRFLDYDDTELKSETVNHGDSATPPANPSRVGYDFSGWEGTYTNITSNVDIKATYTIKTYTVRFLDWDNTVLNTQTINHGSNATPPSYPTRDGYINIGWNRNYTNVTGNIDIVAQYVVDTNPPTPNYMPLASTWPQTTNDATIIQRKDYSISGIFANGATTYLYYPAEWIGKEVTFSIEDISDSTILCGWDDTDKNFIFTLNKDTKTVNATVPTTVASHTITIGLVYQGGDTRTVWVTGMRAYYVSDSSGEVDTSVKNIKIGSSTIDKLYLGTSQILKAYLGSILLYSYSTGGGSSSKNLFNKETAKLNTVADADGIGYEIEFIPQDGYFSSDYIEVKPNTRYIFSSDGVPLKQCFTTFLDENKKTIGNSALNLPKTPSGTKYIVFFELMDYLDTFQLEEYVGKNLFIKENAMIDNKMDQLQIGGEVTPIPQDGYFCSFYMEAEPNTRYIVSHDGVSASKDFTVAFLGEQITVLGFSEESLFTTPAGTKYIIFHENMNYLDTTQLEEYVSKNLFNKATAKLNSIAGAQEAGYELAFGTYEGYFASDYIEAKPNTEYVISNNGVKTDSVIVYFLDENKKAVDGSQNNPFTAPSSAKYIVFCDLMDNLDTIQLEEGNTATDYEPY